MSTEQNKAILCRWLEGCNTRSLSVLDALADELFSADCFLGNAPPGAPVGPELMKQAMRDVFKNTPGLHITIEDMIAEGDRVACRLAVSGTDASTGKPTHLLLLATYRFAGGKIAEMWGLTAPVEPQA